MKPDNCTKLLLLFAFTFWLAAGHAQQTTASYYDSSVFTARKQPQYQAFLAGNSFYAPSTRNQLEIGIKGGSLVVLGDVGGQLQHPGMGLHLRKALSHIYSLRLNYTYGQAQGIGTDKKKTHQFNPAWQGYDGKSVFYNYRTSINDLALEALAVIDNLKFHRGSRHLRLYVIAGLGLTTYQTRVNKLDDAGNLYNFRPVLDRLGFKNDRTIRTELSNILDHSFETAAENEKNTRPKVLGITAIPVAHVGFGLAYKINHRFNIALEERFTFTNSDLLDGNQWEESESGTPYPTRSRDAYNFLSLGLNVNIGKNATEPLWWINPLQYPYSELRNPQLMRLPKVVLPDADGDGITDQFDLEQTPAGVPVDQRGVSRDTDGDGVPDAIDKEPMTPTQCQPVNKDGVGKCPCPEDCLPKK